MAPKNDEGTSLQKSTLLRNLQNSSLVISLCRAKGPLQTTVKVIWTIVEVLSGLYLMKFIGAQGSRVGVLPSPVAIFWRSQAMLLASVRIVWSPSVSRLDSPSVRP